MSYSLICVRLLYIQSSEGLGDRVLSLDILEVSLSCAAGLRHRVSGYRIKVGSDALVATPLSVPSLHPSS